MASANYPSTPRVGDSIAGIPAAQPDCVVFHAGTALKDGVLQTSGGRVLCITALADNVRSTQHRAYDVVKSIHFDGAQYRTDIGWRALEKNNGV
jgi:phosphoribosylamine--glycine ligase